MSVFVTQNLGRPGSDQLRCLRDPYREVEQWSTWAGRYQTITCLFALSTLPSFYYRNNYLASSCALTALSTGFLSHRAKRREGRWIERRKWRQLCENGGDFRNKMAEFRDDLKKLGDTGLTGALGNCWDRFLRLLRIRGASPIPRDLELKIQKKNGWKETVIGIELLLTALEELASINTLYQTKDPNYEKALNYYGAFLRTTSRFLEACKGVAARPSGVHEWDLLLKRKLDAAFFLKLYCCQVTQFSNELEQRRELVSWRSPHADLTHLHSIFITPIIDLVEGKVEYTPDQGPPASHSAPNLGPALSRLKDTSAHSSFS